MFSEEGSCRGDEAESGAGTEFRSYERTRSSQSSGRIRVLPPVFSLSHDEGVGGLGRGQFDLAGINMDLINGLHVGQKLRFAFFVTANNYLKKQEFCFEIEVPQTAPGATVTPAKVTSV